MNYKELAKEILKLHRPDPDVILEVAIEQQATLKQFDESFKEGCEVLAKAHAQLIEAQESEAVWKTERDKADQRRLQAEAEVERLKAELQLAVMLAEEVADEWVAPDFCSDSPKFIKLRSKINQIKATLNSADK